MTHISAAPAAALTFASADDEGVTLLRSAITARFAGRFAVVSSFGADAAMLLALVAEIDRSVPVLFLDTGKHFPETLAYREMLVRRLGLRDVRQIRPDPVQLATSDPDGELHRWIPDDCCGIRKVAPLGRALAGFAAWATGRRRSQSPSRAALRFEETVDGRTKLNPLADWTAERVTAELARRGLPRHPLVAAGYASIGCAPCTRAVRPGEDPRAGRWAGQGKTECGIHLAQFSAGTRAAPGPAPA
jgi:phosphoadenosine phosphosulfate reductase